MTERANDNPDMTRHEAFTGGKALSKAGFAEHGEEIFVPWGRTDNWNLILSPVRAGLNEIGSQKDNALMEFGVSERELGNRSGWEIESSSAFRYWNLDDFRNIPVKVQYLMVAK